MHNHSTRSDDRLLHSPGLVVAVDCKRGMASSKDQQSHYLWRPTLEPLIWPQGWVQTRGYKVYAFVIFTCHMFSPYSFWASVFYIAIFFLIFHWLKAGFVFCTGDKLTVPDLTRRDWSIIAVFQKPLTNWLCLARPCQVCRAVHGGCETVYNGRYTWREW